ncbi:hypothetical protein IP88_16330 [alpha proteobacterium AAP81b]|nr:hypothetical protein IP88_16330 [alpha proteobacterium AAP81b]
MDQANSENVIGAFALGLADLLLAAARREAGDAGPAAALALIGHAPGLSIAMLAQAVGLSHPGAVRLVDRLAADGTVERRRGFGDRREVALHLTAAGEAAAAATLAARNRVITQALAPLSAAETQALAALAARALGGMAATEAAAARICRLCDATRCEDCPVEQSLAAA